MMNHRFREAASLGLGLLLSLLLVPAAHAHAAYESSDPGNGTTVSSPPSRVTAEFTEPVVDDSRLEVYDPCGTRVDNGDSFVAADRITVSMSADKQGTYRVHFSVVSSVDGHPTSGDFGFTSSGGSPCPGEEPAEEEKPSSGDPGNNDNGGGGTDESGDGSGDSGGDRQPATASEQTDGDRAAAGKGPGKSTARDTRRDPSGGTLVKGSRVERLTQDVASAPTAISASGIASIWDGIPISDFLIALLVAAFIGGAGGLVYAGIMGPKV